MHTVPNQTPNTPQLQLPSVVLGAVPRGPSSRPRLQASPKRSIRPRRQSPEQELSLINSLLQGQARAWREFSALYSKVAIGCIRRILTRFNSVTDEHDVEEIYARFCLELLQKDCKKLRRFDPEKGCRLSTWIGMLASNATYDYLRRIKRDSVCEPMPEAEVFEATDKTPFEQAEMNERATIAAGIMRKLSGRDREFVELYFAEGLEAEEVAERMQISMKTVYTKKHKITAKLEALWEKERAA
jgi:RNA polymerase sigma-70 factor (ECF subfamily)